ncbi:methylmalonyl-CoA mutase family protein [Bacillus testis]|uniref:methylmalonyl-CoA mutase family protein n=1 Tax=Bacillus testis TaxID=1622072 RepID=UPI00067EA0C9|nr:methylmalonyl-CoA mutase family protein [Bacillus testis]
MKTLETKAAVFPSVSMEDWERKAEKSLKGKPLEKLYTSTYEGITLKPYYGQGATDNEEQPGEAPYTRGITENPYSVQPWKMVQRLSGDSWEGFLQSLQEAEHRGQRTIVLDEEQLNGALKGQFVRVLKLANEKKYDIFIKDVSDLEPLLAELKAANMGELADMEGYLAIDPILQGASAGKGFDEKSDYFDGWFKSLQEMQALMPGVKTIAVNTEVLHNAGAHAVQELAAGLATASEYIHQAARNGLSADFIAEHAVFTFAIDSRFFMNVAKLRAARRLWSWMGAEFGGDASRFKMNIHSETSSFTATMFDPYVNVLRTANQAFAAVIGGTQSLEVSPYDRFLAPPSAFSERLARNIHLLLKEETQVDKVIDPAGGSFYIERLTDELAERAWELFLDIEERGGILSVLKTGWLQEQIAKTREQKNKDAAVRKQHLIGVNVYADVHEQETYSTTVEKRHHMPFGELQIEALRPVRLAEPYELLRSHSVHYAKRTGQPPEIGLICLGSLKSYKGRADFSKELLATVAIKGTMKECATLKEADDFVQQSNLSHFILCGSDAEYEEKALAWVEAIKENHPHVRLLLAGKMDGGAMEALQSAGLDGCMAAGSDTIEVAGKLLKEMGVM